MHKREDKTNRDASYLYRRRMINTRLHRPHVIDVSVFRVSLYVTPTQCTLVSSGQSVESYIQNVHVIRTLTDARTCSPSPTDRPSLSLSRSLIEFKPSSTQLFFQRTVGPFIHPPHVRSLLPCPPAGPPVIHGWTPRRLPTHSGEVPRRRRSEAGGWLAGHKAAHSRSVRLCSCGKRAGERPLQFTRSRVVPIASEPQRAATTTD